MQNIQQQLYESNIEKFARTIVIKYTDAAIAINKALRETGYRVDPNPRTWKYYLNLAGQYHASNKPMTIVSLDTLETIDFNIESLEIHLGTKREYVYGSIYYNDLVARYPDQELLIKGIINPIPMDLAINAPDGQILSYDQTLIEPQETTLIPELQQWIFNTLLHATVPGFKVTDELYHLGIWANIFGHLAAWVRTKRWENCHTTQAHSYHIWNYLESKGRLGEYRRYLNNTQAQWLYRNIRWVDRHAGTQESFSALLDKILTERNIPLGEYSFLPDVSKLGKGPLPLSSQVSGIQVSNLNLKPIPRLLRTPLNLFDVVSKKPVIKTIQYVSEEQIPLARDNRTYLLENVAESETQLSTSPLGTLPIKVYQSDMIDTSDQQVYSLADLLLNHWLRLAHTGRYVSVINIADPRTTELMAMTTKDAFLAYVYTWSKSNGLALTKIPTFNALMTRKVRLPSRRTLRRLFPKGVIPDRVLLALIKDQEPIGTVVSTEGFYVLIYKIWTSLIRQYKLVSYMENYNTRAYLEAVVLDFYENAGCYLGDYPDQTFEDYFSARGWTITTLNRVDNDLVNKELWEKSTGIDTQNILRVKDVQSAMLSLMKRLGTYAVQYLQSINDQPAILLNWPAIRFGHIGMTQNANVPIHLGVSPKGVRTKGQSRSRNLFTSYRLTSDSVFFSKHTVNPASIFGIKESITVRAQINLGGITPTLANAHELNQTVPPGLDY